MIRILFSYLATLIGTIAGIIGIYVFFNDQFNKLNEDGKVGVIIIGIFTFIFFVESLYFKNKWARSSKYGNILEKINEGFSYIHDLYRRSNEINITDIHRALESLCNKVAEAYSIISGVQCSCCIKILNRDNVGQVHVITFCRSSNANRNYAKEQNVKHYINLNTDYKRILEEIQGPKGRAFFSNILPFIHDYQNTSFAIYGHPKKATIKIDNMCLCPLRSLRWPLPYKSTIVVPLLPGRGELHLEENLVGFICIDSKKLLTFQKDYDIDLLSGIADGIYQSINLLKSKQTQ